jgi:hypothetical protein
MVMNCYIVIHNILNSVCFTTLILQKHRGRSLRSRDVLDIPHVKIETRLIDERFASVMGECVIVTLNVHRLYSK